MRSRVQIPIAAPSWKKLGNYRPNGRFFLWLRGAQFGFREAKGTGDAVTVLNNDTKEWEGINSVVEQD